MKTKYPAPWLAADVPAIAEHLRQATAADDGLARRNLMRACALAMIDSTHRVAGLELPDAEKGRITVAVVDALELALESGDGR